MTEKLDLQAWTPPEDPVEMPYQVLERPRPHRRSWLAWLRQLVTTRARHE